MNEIAYILIGWLLGLLAPAITSRITGRYRIANIRNGVVRELIHLENTAASTYLMIEIHRGRFTKSLLTWYSPYLQYDDVPAPFDKAKEVLPGLLNLTEDQFSAATQHLTPSQDCGMHLRSFALPYSSTKLGDLDSFSEDSTRHILTLFSRVNIINQQIEDSIFSYNLTYSSSISPENHQSVSNQLLSTYDAVATQVKVLIENTKAAKNAMKV